MFIHKLRLPLAIQQCKSLVGSFTRTKSLKPASQLHAFIIISGITNEPILSQLSVLYSLCKNSNYAHHLFNKVTQKSRSLYSFLIRSHVQLRENSNALQLFAEMFSSGHRADNFSFSFALKACSELQSIDFGLQIHCNAYITGYVSDEHVSIFLVRMYMKCNRKEDAYTVFHAMGCKIIAAWNIMILGLRQNGFLDEAISVFYRMLDEGFSIDCTTVVSVLPLCAQLRDLDCGNLVHDLAKANGFDNNTMVTNSLIDMYAKCGCLKKARSVFEAGKKDVVTWTAMIGGYILNQCFDDAIIIFHQMQLSGVRPNMMTMTSLLSACGNTNSLKHGKCVHALCIRLELESYIGVETAIIDMYSRCNSTDVCLSVFSISSKGTGAWNAVISGFNLKGQANDSVKFFKLMLHEKASQDFVTVVSVLPAYSTSADTKQAKNLHSYLIKVGFLKYIEVSTGLIDLYAKAGSLDVAWYLFYDLPVKDFVAWSAMINGYGMHGHTKIAIRLLDQMVESGIEPNEVTFLSLMHSCSHSGFVDEGLELFDRMTNVHKLKPKHEHYSCVVHLLGGKGMIEEAYELIKAMPFEANHSTWGALLGSCVIHENLELGEVAARRLFELEPENTGNYVRLGKIYMAKGKWEDAEKLTDVMMQTGLKKEPGCSFVPYRSFL